MEIKVRGREHSPKGALPELTRAQSSRQRNILYVVNYILSGDTATVRNRLNLFRDWKIKNEDRADYPDQLIDMGSDSLQALYAEFEYI